MDVETSRLAKQLGHDLDLVGKEIGWALGEERINRVMPSIDQFRAWERDRQGLSLFWGFANQKLTTPLTQEEAMDIWKCVDLTLSARKRRPLGFMDYLMIAMNSEQKCEFCNRRPPEVRLDIDHILPVSRGGTNISHNLRFLCTSCNRSKGNRFRWADIWRKI